MKDKYDIAGYLRTITGRSEAFQAKILPEAELPRYIGSLYELCGASVLGVPVVIAMLKPSAAPSVIEMSRHYELLKARTGSEVVFAGDNITTRTAERLVRRRIPHIVVGRQLYLPFLFLDIKSGSPLFEGLAAPAKLNPWAEALLIRQLLRRDLEGMSGADIARDTATSPMTAQRAVSQLVAAKLCQLEERGKRKILRFEDTVSLWNDAVKILTPPLAMTLTLKALPSKLPVFVAGASALARSTLLSEEELPVFAASRRLYKHADHSQPVFAEEAKVILELWERDPALTAKDGVVDPISLYLNMRDGDERVRIALAELLRQHELGESL